MNSYSSTTLKPVEGYFRRSKQTVFWIFVFAIAVIIGSAVIVIGLLEQQIELVFGAVVALLILSIVVIRRQNRQRVKVSLSDGTLLIQGGGYHIQMQAPFRYQTGIQRIRATRRTPEFYYVRMVVDVYGKPLVFEEQVPSGIQPPPLEEIVSISSALGIAELSSTDRYPGILWELIQQLELMSGSAEADKVKQDIEDLYRIGGEHLYKQRYAEAVKIFSEIIRLTPDSPSPYYNRGMARYYLRRDFDKAITDLTTALRLKPKFDKAYRLRGLVKAEQGDWEGLRDDCTKAIELSPADGELYNLRGGACYRLKDYQSALRDFEKAIQLSQTNPEPYHNRGLVKQRIGNLEGAISDFQYALQLDPLFELARDSLVRAEAEKRQLDLNQE